MYPSLLSIGPVTISSFGFLAALGLFLAIFVIWKLSTIYDFNGEKVLDLAIITFGIAFLGARLLFVLLNPNIFTDISNAFLINRYPGLSFEGGFIVGLIAFYFLCRYFRLIFWQVADLFVVGVALGLALGNLGCFLGGCYIGIPYQGILASNVVGIIGTRFPISLIEGLALFLLFIILYKQIIKFHFAGKVLALFLIFLGTIKLISGFYLDKKVMLPFVEISFSRLTSIALLLAGFAIFDFCSKHSIITLPKKIWEQIKSERKRSDLALVIRKSCYNYQVEWKIRLTKLMVFFRTLSGKMFLRKVFAEKTLFRKTLLKKTFLRKIKKKLNVKPTPEDYQSN